MDATGLAACVAEALRRPLSPPPPEPPALQPRSSSSTGLHRDEAYDAAGLNTAMSQEALQNMRSLMLVSGPPDLNKIEGRLDDMLKKQGELLKKRAAKSSRDDEDDEQNATEKEKALRLAGEQGAFDIKSTLEGGGTNTSARALLLRRSTRESAGRTRHNKLSDRGRRAS